MNYIKWKIEECPTDKLKMFTAAGYPPLLAAMLGARGIGSVEEAESFLDGGAELLIHVGIDTVKMDGTGFTKKVSDGAKVHAGDVLIEANLNAIKEAGHPATTMMILTNTDLYDSVECAAPGTVTGKSSVMKLTK